MLVTEGLAGETQTFEKSQRRPYVRDLHNFISNESLLSRLSDVTNLKVLSLNDLALLN